jgi:hypothetical protein
MSVPLDRLYNHLDGLCNHDVIIYRFMPHGSKKLEDLKPLSHPGDWLAWLSTPMMICHDQEPLHYELYSAEDIHNTTSQFPWSPALRDIASSMHLRGVTGFPQNCFDLTLLAHSEVNSDQLARYEENGFVGVYWWSHAVIARDWYRYAQLDVDLEPNFDNIQSDFLVYNRAWCGTREYRLKFAELVVNAGLEQSCQMRFSPDDNQHYTKHKFVNPTLTINRRDLEQHFEINTSDAGSSADYESKDYATTGMEIVLETLFDDQRWHLTEKTLRPIACGRPFMLAATPGSLQYLRRYGFRTFGECIDESYDLIQDPVERLNAITQEMKRIADLDLLAKKELWSKLYEIAKYNKELFFSDTWHNSIFEEFVDNINQALGVMWQHRTGKYWLDLQSKITKPFYDPSGRVKAQPVEKLHEWLAADVPQIKASI